MEATDKTDKVQLKDAIVATLQSCYDPEIPVDIYELGLIYEVKVGDDGYVDVLMTLTSPACPVAGTLPPEVEPRLVTPDILPASPLHPGDPVRLAGFVITKVDLLHRSLTLNLPHWFSSSPDSFSFIKGALNVSEARKVSSML